MSMISNHEPEGFENEDTQAEYEAWLDTLPADSETPDVDVDDVPLAEQLEASLDYWSSLASHRTGRPY